MTTVLYQAVEIHLTDGRKGAFMGPVLITEADERAGVRIRQVRFIEAKPLPPGYSFEPFGEAPQSPVTPPESTGGTRAPPPPQEPAHARPRARKPRKAQ